MLLPAGRRVSETVRVKRVKRVKKGYALQHRWLTTSGAPPWRPAAVLDEYVQNWTVSDALTADHFSAEGGSSARLDPSVSAN